MAAVQCIKCTAERRGFRRELDSWRHKLIHCIGFESILEGIYGPLLLRDLNLFADCEPEEVDDWSPDGSCSQCSFCHLSLDKLGDQVPAASPPLSSPSEYSPCQASTTIESLSAHRFLQAVFHKKDVPSSCDSNIPLIAQELMKKMIHQFALEYASECLLQTSANGVTRTSTPMSEASDAPLDLTVSRAHEGKESEPEPDGVLDLSNRNSACSTTSSSSSSSSSNLKASGSPPSSSLTEEQRDQVQRRTKFRCALDAVLGSLCRAHRSLLYQILKLARQEKSLTFVNHKQTESHCCHSGIKPQAAPHPVPFSQCKPHNCNQCFAAAICDHQAVSSAVCHPQHCKSTWSSHDCHSKDCDGDTRHNVSYSCVHMCRLGESTAGCSERMHCNSCHSSAAGHNIVCSFAPSPLLCAPSNMCPTLSIGSNCHNGHSCSCSANKVGLTQVRSSTRKELGDGDPPCPVLKREQSPSPPPLSPIPSDIDKKTDEKPPSLLHHRQDEQTELGIEINCAKTSRQETDVDVAAADESQRETSESDQAEKNQSGTSLQDVMNRFSEKLDTIRPLDKDPALTSAGVCVSEKEKPPIASTSRSLQFRADAHLTEIITTVLHTGRASDYNLSELFNRHDNGEPKSPNTRSRRRQEVLAAIATPADDASTRRHTLQIKRELALLDPSCSKRRIAGSKKWRLKQGNVTVSHPSPDPDEVKDVSKEETKVGVLASANDKVKEGIPDLLPTESNSDDVKEEIQTVIITEDFQTVKAEAKEREISSNEKEFAFSDIPVPDSELQCNGNQDSKDEGGDTGEISGTLSSTQRCGRPRKSQVDVNSAVLDMKLVNSSSVDVSETVNKAGRNKKYRNQVKKKKYQLNRSEEARKSGRNIVLPQRFSSYVTEPRKMFFVACFSEKIFNREAQKDSDLTPNMLHGPSEDPDIRDAQLVSRSEEDSSVSEDPEKLPIEASQKQHGPTSTKPTNEVQISPPTVGEEQRPEKDSSDNTTGSDCDVTPVRKLRSSPRRPRPLLMCSSPSDKDSSVTPGARVENPSTFQIQYTSPIKLMFVSPVMDEGGVRYSLKSASSGSGIQAEHFDPFEESSWSGAPQKHNSPIKEPAPSREKSVSSPLKSATSRTRSASSSPKSASSSPKPASSSHKSASSPGKLVSSPAKSASSPPKSASSPRSTTSPKIGSRRSGESTPTKRIAGSESQGSPGDLAGVHETTPPKRRPGRPKKLGPQLEQKVKRPIGRPRKEKSVDPVKEAKTTGKDLPSPDEENVNKNLKITVMYGRSRRNKRTVSEGFDQLQTEFSDACKAVGLKSDFGILLDNSSTNSDCIKASEELNFITPAKELALQSSSNIKCQKRDDSVPSRKPGRPAKVKISGISVTITTVSPRQRKIQINKDYLRPSETTAHKKALLPHFKSAKEPRTISSHSPSKITPAEEVIGTENESQDGLSKKPVAVRHSMRVRKPSIHFLRAVATSGFKSYSRSNALLRRSKQLLLSKASNERRQEGLQRSVETSREDKPLSRREGRNCSQDIGKVAGVSVASIFTPKETIRWWAPSAEQQTMNQELARRIRVISDTWVSDSVENKETTLNRKLGSKGKSCVTGKSKQSSVVRTLFDCSPDKPRSCSMQQICSWFMQTTETQSLSIVKKASSRHTYDPVQFSRSANKISVSSSPQAERLRRHIKKFAKAVPKTPSQHREAQRRLRKKIEARLSTRNVKRQLFTHNFSKGKANQGVQLWRSREKGNFQAILMRARIRFLTKRDRLGWQKKQNKKNIKVPAPSSRGRAATLQPERKALRRSAEDDSNCLGSSSAVDSAEQTREPVDVCKELNLCSKAWSPETLKECRVFLRKINSPDNESTEEEWDSCTVTLDNGSHSACLFAGRGRELVKVVKAVKTERKQRLSRRTASTELAASAPPSVLKPDETSLKRQRGKHKSPEVASAEPSQSPPAKMLRQSRVRGLTGPKWSDFVLES